MYIIYILHQMDDLWPNKLVDWYFVFPCWSYYLQCCCYCNILLKGQADGLCERFYDRQLPSSNLRCFCYYCLFLNASFFWGLNGWNGSHRLVFSFTSPFLRFTSVICFLWEDLYITYMYMNMHISIYMYVYIHLCVFNK